MFWKRKNQKEQQHDHQRSPKCFRPSCEALEVRIVPFKPYTHIATGQDVLADVLNPAHYGQITLPGLPGHQYAVPTAVVKALQDYPAFYDAGVVGPDGFPDLIMGQSVIHPIDTGRWLSHVLNSAWLAQQNLNPDLSQANYTDAEKCQILAFSYGFLTHAAGDFWGHTLVNEFAQGIFPSVTKALTDSNQLANALRHVITEEYISDATTGFDHDNSVRKPLPDGDISDDSTPAIPFNAPVEFIYQTFVKKDVGPRDPQTNELLLGNDRGVLLNFFYSLRAGLVSATEKIGAVKTGIDGAINSVLNAQKLEAAAKQKVADAQHNLDDAKQDLDKAKDNLSKNPLQSLIDALKAAVKSAQAAVDAAQATLDAAGAELSRDTQLVVDATFNLFQQYLLNWIDDIDDGLRHWGELGLGITKALFDPQARRDEQNDVGRGLGSDTTDLTTPRSRAEDGVGVFDVVEAQTNDFVNNHLLAMLGAPVALHDGSYDSYYARG
jgi:hypothetical protein